MVDESLIVNLAPPRFAEHGGMTVAGLCRRYSFETNVGIPEQWRDFGGRAGEIAAGTGELFYGVCYNSDDEGNFDYMAGVEVTTDNNLPDGMDAVTVPPGRYIVFTHSGDIADFRKTAYTVWHKGLADADVTHRPAPDFELYDHRFDASTGRGDVEYWVPIE